MRIAFFGLSLSSAWGNGQTTALRALLRGLHARGHHVEFFERDQPFYAAHRDLHRPGWCRLRLYRDWHRVRNALLRRLRAFDALVLASYCPGGAAIAADLLNLSGPRKIYYDLDTPVTLSGLAASDPAVLDYIDPAALPAFNLVLSFSGGESLDRLRAAGARRVAPLYLGVDPRVHAPVAPPPLRCRLGCLATYSPDRWPALREALLAPAAAMPGESFLLAGAMYPAHPWPPNLRRCEHVAPGRHARFYAGCDFVLNLTRAAMRQSGFAPQARLFEAAACGVPVISDAWPGLEVFFEPGRELLVAASAAEVTAILRSTSRADRRRIAWRARRRALACHTGRHRAAECERLLLAIAGGGSLRMP